MQARSRGLLRSRLRFFLPVPASVSAIPSGVPHASCPWSARPRPLAGRTGRAKRPRQRRAFPTRPSQAATQLRERALADDTAWDVVESLTTEVGPRLAGSEADARAVQWAEAKFKAAGLRQGVAGAGELPEMGASQRTRRGRRRACAAAGDHRARRQRRRHRRGRGRALRRSGRAAGRARRLARRQDRLHRLPDGTQARRQRLRPGLAHPQQRPVGGDPRRRGRLPDAFGRHRLAPQSAHRHHPLRRRPRRRFPRPRWPRPMPTSSRACWRAGRCA